MIKSIPEQIKSILDNAPKFSDGLFYNGEGECFFYKSGINFEAEKISEGFTIYGLVGIGRAFIAKKRNNKWIF